MIKKAILCAMVAIILLLVSSSSLQSSMRVTFERSGGFAGLMLTTSVDAATLPAPEVEHLRQMVNSANFFQLPAVIPSAAQPDRFQYQVTVEMDGRRHSVQVGETSVPDSLRPLLEWCMEKVRGG